MFVGQLRAKAGCDNLECVCCLMLSEKMTPRHCVPPLWPDGNLVCETSAQSVALVLANLHDEPTVLVRQGKNKNHQNGGLYFWWPWSDSNRHSLQNLILSQARLPIPPRGQNQCAIISRRLSWLLLFLPSGHCVQVCEPAFSQVQQPCLVSFQSLS